MVVRPEDDRHGFYGGDPRPAGEGFRSVGHDACSGRTERDPDRLRTAEVIAAGVHDAQPAQIPARLCRVAVTLLPVVGASVSLRSDGMSVRLGASSDQASYLAELQTTLGDGPFLYASEAAAPVLACDLTAGRDVCRWPVFAQQVTAAGVQAVYSLPLGNDTVTVGTLDLYRATPGGLTEDELNRALMVAGVMTLAVMTLPREEAGSGAGERWLGGLATDHDKVYQAIGMIMAQLGVDADEATARLRARAFTQGRTALDVARDVVAHRVMLEGG
ncbi:GAF and ANTAR domain-containing protein [Streptomyces sp. NBC_00078]|uniref:GAF and ANTAR domain-containing protein n=1 Tax=unclassified Streptomyces TaxID=2593676 RepID=UPI00225751AC|nr:GAF and ANTAR domain-containing protein [Streptomyces sp. NBC_00078]MCX5422256.1 GAF and ANTAR domain-containing protein [Streptomyces sp. NBC_00078]